MREWEIIMNDYSKDQKPSLELLKSTSIITNDGFDDFVLFIDKKTLPTDPQKRFESLFKYKKEWLESDLIKFMKDSVSDQILNKFLKKLTKLRQTQKEKIYSLK